MARNQNQNPEETTSSEATQTEKQPAAQKSEIDPVNDFGDFVRSDEKAQKFMMMYVLSHDLKGLEDFKDELKRRQFLADFEAWKKAGEPGVSMPKIPKSEIKFPTAVYRIRDRGNDKLYVYFSDGTEEGIQYIPKYEQIENAITGEMENTNMKIGQTENYTMKFDTETAKRLINDYNKLAPPGTNPLQLYIWFGDNKQIVSEKNFFKSYENLAELHNNKKALN